MEPEGILNACTTKVRMTKASAKATRIASAYSRNVDFLFFPDVFKNLLLLEILLTAENAESAEGTLPVKAQNSILLNLCTIRVLCGEFL